MTREVFSTSLYTITICDSIKSTRFTEAMTSVDSVAKSPVAGIYRRDAYHFPSLSSMESFLRRRGFTLIELLLVIGIIAILASIVIIAINPNRQLGQARDAQRRSDVNTILNAVYQYAIDNNGNIPGSGSITTTDKSICMKNTSYTDCNSAGLVYLGVLTGAYLLNIPQDPSLSSSLTGTGTRYFIKKDANNRITVTAKGAEQSATAITVTR